MSYFLEGSGMEAIHRVSKPIILYLGEGIKFMNLKALIYTVAIHLPIFWVSKWEILLLEAITSNSVK